MRCINQLEIQPHKKAGKGLQAYGIQRMQVSMTRTILIASCSGGNGEEDSADDCDPSMSKDENESLVKEEPPTKKKGLNEQGKNSNPLITKLTKTLQLTKHVGPTTNGELASLVDKIMREKANEDKKNGVKETRGRNNYFRNCSPA